MHNNLIAAKQYNRSSPFFVAGLIIITVLYQVIIFIIMVLLSPIIATTLLSIITAVIVNAIIFLLDTKYQLKFIFNFKAWAGKKQANLSPKIERLVEVSKIGGIFVSSLLLGPPPTALLIDALGFRKPLSYILATASGIFFCVILVLVYTGSLALLEFFFNNMTALTP